jgi:hypothetical protein
MHNFNGNNYKLYFCDTCALSDMIKDKPGFGSNLPNLILKDGIIAVSPYSLWEIKNSPVVYDELVNTITKLPVCLLKTEQILYEDEFNSLNNDELINPIITHLIASSFKEHNIDIIKIIEENISIEKANTYKKDQSDTFNSFILNNPTFLDTNKIPSKMEIESSAKLYAYSMVTKEYYSILKYYSKRGLEFPIDKIQSALTIAYFLHYKFIENGRKPLESDITDSLLSSVFPYIDVAITDGNQCEIIKRIQRDHKFLLNLEPVSMKFMKNNQF